MRLCTKNPNSSFRSHEIIPEEGQCKALRVVHNYTDHANDDLYQDFLTPTLEITSASRRGDAKRVTMSFPPKLHQMLSQTEDDGLTSTVRWQPHGRCFIVCDQTQFTEQIMPTYFRQTKFSSFQRQLNLYGFNRITSGTDKGAYYHELFLRGKDALAYRIQRLKIKGTGVRKAGSPETEPCFYSMPSLSRCHAHKEEQPQDSHFTVGCISEEDELMPSKVTSKIICQIRSFNVNVIPIESEQREQDVKIKSDQKLQQCIQSSSSIQKNYPSHLNNINPINVLLEQAIKRQRYMPSEMSTLSVSLRSLLKSQSISPEQYLQHSKSSLDREISSQDQEHHIRSKITDLVSVKSDEEFDEEEFDEILELLDKIPIEEVQCWILC